MAVTGTVSPCRCVAKGDQGSPADDWRRKGPSLEYVRQKLCVRMIRSFRIDNFLKYLFKVYWCCVLDTFILHRPSWFSDNNPALYSGGAGFKSPAILEGISWFSSVPPWKCRDKT
jgi:hypothetical protein